MFLDSKSKVEDVEKQKEKVWKHLCYNWPNQKLDMWGDKRLF